MVADPSSFVVAVVDDVDEAQGVVGADIDIVAAALEQK